MDKLFKGAGKEELLLGNEALVRGALEAGMAFATCYPGTPSSEVPDTLYRLKKTEPKKAGYYFEYSTNEKVALEVAAGAAVSGLRTLCTMKHVGLNVAADPLMTLAYVGVRGGMVILTADDPSLFSSQNEQDNRFYARLSGLPMLEPASPAEIKEMTKYAFELSEKLESPVFLRTTTRVNHTRGPVKFERLAKVKKQAKFVKNPFRFVTVPAVSRNLHLRLLKVFDQAQAISETSPYNTISGRGEWGIVTCGVCANYVSDALAELGATSKIKVFKLGMSWPLPEKKLLRFMKSVKKLFVVEELEPQVEKALRALAQEKGLKLDISGKQSKIPDKSVDVAPPAFLSRAYEYNPRLVRDAIATTFKLKHKNPSPVSMANLPQLPGRPPNLCPGCPHRATYYAIKQVVGKDAIFPTDIGCYTLGLLPPISMADFVICMGSSVSGACGISRATGQKVVAFIGDSTFFHSGLTGLVNAVHNKHDITLVILDNGTTAMTGHQPHPGVDTKALGDATTHVDIEQAVRGLGVEQVTVIKPFKLKSSMAAIKQTVEQKGVKVIISKELCPLFARRVAPRTRKPFQVDPNLCKDHMDCINTVACPAMYKEEGRVRINTLQCIGCARSAPRFARKTPSAWPRRVETMDIKRIVNVGVGGQGNLLASNLLGLAALDAKVPVVVSEIHGMAQRGGVVESAVILGGATSPIVSQGEADVLVSFEPVETLRALGKVNRNSLVISNIRPLPPFTVAIGAPYPDPDEAMKLVKRKVKSLVAFDGQALAEQAKNPLSLNMVMLGALFAVGQLPVPLKSAKKMIRSNTKKRFVDSNLKAFDLGFEAALAA